MTSQAADVVGWGGALGEIRPGLPADLVLFDPGVVADRATFESPWEHPVGIVGRVGGRDPPCRRWCARDGTGLRRRRPACDGSEWRPACRRRAAGDRVQRRPPVKRRATLSPLVDDALLDERDETGEAGRARGVGFDARQLAGEGVRLLELLLPHHDGAPSGEEHRFHDRHPVVGLVVEDPVGDAVGRALPRPHELGPAASGLLEHPPDAPGPVSAAEEGLDPLGTPA